MSRTRDHSTSLRASFTHAWRGLGARDRAPFEDVVARYSEPQRAYHDVEHLRECLGWLSVSEELSARPLEVRLAVFYHDVVYCPRAVDNEERSADLFRAHASIVQLPSASRERIVRLIEGTALHRAHDSDSALLNDIDLAVLGASPRQYARYEAQIRREFREFDDRAYRAGRARVLRSFLDMTSIYRTIFFNQRLEPQARSNLSNALRALEAGENSESPKKSTRLGDVDRRRRRSLECESANPTST